MNDYQKEKKQSSFFLMVLLLIIVIQAAVILRLELLRRDQQRTLAEMGLFIKNYISEGNILVELRERELRLKKEIQMKNYQLEELNRQIRGQPPK